VDQPTVFTGYGNPIEIRPGYRKIDALFRAVMSMNVNIMASFIV
jgi:hypothetical protein